MKLSEKDEVEHVYWLEGSEVPEASYRGKPVHLNRLRIVKSCEMLLRTDKKITEIASLCGFNNISYFNRTFYKIMGISPSGYRGSLSNPFPT